LAKAKAKAQRIKCTNNLKNIGLAFRTYATDNQDQFPMTLPIASGGCSEYFGTRSDANAQMLVMAYRCMSNELSTPKIIVCPTDSKNEATNWDMALTNLTYGGSRATSYGIGLDAQETYPSMLLSMDRNITNAGSGTVASGGTALSSALTKSVYAILSSNQPTTAGGAGWSDTMHQNNGNAALGDGSVQGLSSTRLKEQLRNSGDPSNAVYLPAPGTSYK